MVPRSLRSLLLFFLSIVLCSRGYIIDDRQVTFVPTSGPKAWQQFSDPPAYAGTTTDNSCLTTDGCSFKFTFTGSGVSLTRCIVTGTSIPLQATVTVDGATQPDISVPDGSPVTVVYNLQSLPYGHHSMVVTLVTYSGGVASHLRLDSIDVNDTVTSHLRGLIVQRQNTLQTTIRPSTTSTIRPSTTSGSAAQTSSASGQPPSSDNLGPIIGGVVGGVVVLILFVLTLLYLRRRARAPKEESPTKIKRALSSLFGTIRRTHDAPPPRPAAATPLLPLTGTSSGIPGSATPSRTRLQQTAPSSAPAEYPPPPIPFLGGLAANRSQDSLDRKYGKIAAPTHGKPTATTTNKLQSTTADPIPNAASHTSGSVTNTSSQSLPSGPPLVTVPTLNRTLTTQPINTQPVASGPPLVTVPVPASNRTPITQPINPQPVSSGPPLAIVPVSNSTPLTRPIVPESTSASVPTSKPTRPLPNPRQATSSGPPLFTIPTSNSTPVQQPTDPQLKSSGPPLITPPTSNPTPLKQDTKPNPASSGPPLVVFNATPRPQDSTSALSTTSSVPSSSRLTQVTYSSTFSSPRPSRHLTEEEVEYIAGLYRQQLPPSDVARVVESMLRREPRARQDSLQGDVMAPTSVEDLPPYDTKLKS